MESDHTKTSILIVNDHNHVNMTVLGPGILKIGKYTLEVIRSAIYLEMIDLGDEQRICITFTQPVNLKKIIETKEVFIAFLLKNSFYVPDSNIPVNKLDLFSLSGIQDNQTQIDFLISPRVELMDGMLHPNF